MAVKNSDMYYAYSNNEGIKEKGEYGGVVTTIMKHLLESNVVDGIVAVKEGFDLYDAVETEFATAFNETGGRYGRKKYSGYKD